MYARIDNILLAAAIATVLTPCAEARITRIEIQKTDSPTFEGAAFGNTGQYEKLSGRAYGELDPRPSLQERYGSKDTYVARVKAAAGKLVGERFLLPEDTTRLIAENQRTELGV